MQEENHERWKDCGGDSRGPCGEKTMGLHYSSFGPQSNAGKTGVLTKGLKV